MDFQFEMKTNFGFGLLMCALFSKNNIEKKIPTSSLTATTKNNREMKMKCNSNAHKKEEQTLEKKILSMRTPFFT